ncbi:MAG: hypothetical protein R3C14_19375 [Caldilineaceae bacterium]
MSNQNNFTIFDSPVKGWGGEWHGFESRVREAERLANGYWFDGLDVLPYRADQHPALAEVEMLARDIPDEHAATPGNVQKLLAHLAQPNIAGHNIPFDKAQIAHLRTLILQAGDLVLDYFNTFSERFHDALVLSASYPPVRVNATLMRQMATDLHIAESAMQQRLRDQNNFQSWLGYGLYTADLVAYATIQPLKEIEIIPPETAIVTHLQRQTEVRLVPYYDILFVGLPLAMINVYDLPPRPYLAIPHEIGHFLYHYGTVQQGAAKTRIDQALKSVLAGEAQEAWQTRWLEEIFADTFGCLLAGPVSVLEFQALLADDPAEHLSECGGKHPTPALRPFVQSEILRQITLRKLKSYTHAPDLLDSHWQMHLNRYVPALSGNALDKKFMIDGQPITGQEILNGSKIVIEKILDLFLELFGNGAHSPAHWDTWSEDVPEPVATDVHGVASFTSLQNAAKMRMPLDEHQASYLRAVLKGLNEQFDAFYFYHRTDPQRSTFRRSNIKPPAPVDDTKRPTTNYQAKVKQLWHRLENWQYGEARIAVEEWLPAFDVPEWSTEGPEMHDDQ